MKKRLLLVWLNALLAIYAIVFSLVTLEKYFDLYDHNDKGNDPGYLIAGIILALPYNMGVALVPTVFYYVLEKFNQHKRNYWIAVAMPYVVFVITSIALQSFNKAIMSYFHMLMKYFP